MTTSARKKESKKVSAKEKAKAKTKEVVLKRMDIRRARVRIIGTSPLIHNTPSSKARNAIRDKKGGSKTKDREPCNPQQEAHDSAYMLSDGSYGFPVTGIKDAIREASHRDIGVPRSLISKGMFIIAQEGRLTRIEHGLGPKVQEDVVRLPTGAMDLRYRTTFEEWAISLDIEYDADALTLEVIVNMIERAGFGVGIGDWRPQKNGLYGRFQVERGEEGK